MAEQIECCADFGYRWEAVGLTPYCKKERFGGLSCNSTLEPKKECYRKGEGVEKSDVEKVRKGRLL